MNSHRVNLFVVALTMLVLPARCALAEEQEFFGAWSISKGLHNYIREVLPEGRTMVELGSGWGSEQLSKHYTVWSIEHNSEWVGKYDTHYIYAPIVNNWYDSKIIKEQLPKDYDLLLIDGPAQKPNRRDLFFDNIDLFKTDIPIIVDDVQWKEEYKLMVKIADHLQRKFKVFKSKQKKFGVILLEKADA